jgi:hypothetical protein
LKGEHLVLRNKASKKIASRRNQSHEAMTLEAQRLTADGVGGGITSLLLPTSLKGEVALAKIAEIYTADRVKARPGGKSGQVDRKRLKAAMANDELFAKLISLYSEYIGSEPGPQTKSVKAFTGWLKGVFKRPGSPAYKVVFRIAPVLLEVERGDPWWGSAIAQRRKTQS